MVTRDLWNDFVSMQSAFRLQIKQPIIGIDPDMGRVTYACFPGTSYPVWRSFFIDPIVAKWGKKKLEEQNKDL